MTTSKSLPGWQPKRRSKRLGPRRRFRVFLRRDKRRVHVFSLTCGSEEQERSQARIDFPEKAVLLPAEAAIEYEECGRKAKRYAARFPKDAEMGQALFGSVRSESRLLLQLLGDSTYVSGPARPTVHGAGPIAVVGGGRA